MVKRLDNSNPSLSIHNGGAIHSDILEFPPLQTNSHVCLFSFYSLYRDHGIQAHQYSLDKKHMLKHVSEIQQNIYLIIGK